MLPTPRRSFWLRSALLMGVLRRRKRARKCSRSISRGSTPAASKLALGATLMRPKRRGSTKRSSRPEASLAMARVCFSIAVAGLVTSRRPVMPRWTIHWERGPRDSGLFLRWADRPLDFDVFRLDELLEESV